MRFFVKCDICNSEFYCEKTKLPKEILLVDGLDMCKDCRIQYNKRLKKMISGLQKERFKLKIKQKEGVEMLEKNNSTKNKPKDLREYILGKGRLNIKKQKEGVGAWR